MSDVCSVGEQLKQARAALRLTLKDVTQTTKIQPWVLDALERDQLHTAMSPIYVKSFLATYAKLVRLDPQPLIAQLFPEVPAEHAAEEPAPELAMPRPTLREWLRVCVASLSSCVRFVHAHKAAAFGLLGIVVVLHLGPWQKATPRAARQEASVSVTPPGPAAPDAAVNLQPTQPLELVLTARRATWVSVKVDGLLVAHRQLAMGAQETWRARRSFEVIIAKPSQIEAVLNGQTITPQIMAHQGRVVITHKHVKPLASLSEP